MHFLDFKRMPLSAQAHLICRHGVHLSERTEGDYFIALYALFGFYAEVHYRFADSEVLFITSFYTTNLLEPYLAKVQISHLLQPVAAHLNWSRRECRALSHEPAEGLRRMP